MFSLLIQRGKKDSDHSPKIYKNTNGILVGFSLIDKKSFSSIEFWLDQISENCNDK